MEKGLFFLFVVVMDGKKMMMAAASLPVLGVLFLFFVPKIKVLLFWGVETPPRYPPKEGGVQKKKKKFQISLKNKKFSF